MMELSPELSLLKTHQRERLWDFLAVQLGVGYGKRKDAQIRISRNRELVFLYFDGMPLREIGEKFNISKYRVYQQIVKLKRCLNHPINREKVKDLLEDALIE